MLFYTTTICIQRTDLHCNKLSIERTRKKETRARVIFQSTNPAECWRRAMKYKYAFVDDGDDATRRSKILFLCILLKKIYTAGNVSYRAEFNITLQRKYSHAELFTRNRKISFPLHVCSRTCAIRIYMQCKCMTRRQ